VVIGLADIMAPPFRSLPGVIDPLRSDACKAFTMHKDDFMLETSGTHGDALDFLPSVQARLIPHLR